MVRYPPQKGALGTGQPYKVLNWSWQWQSALSWLPIADQPRNCTWTQTEKRKQKKMEAALQRDTIFHSDLSCLCLWKCSIMASFKVTDQFWQSDHYKVIIASFKVISFDKCVFGCAKFQYVRGLAKVKAKQKQIWNTTEGTNFPRR